MAGLESPLNLRSLFEATMGAISGLLFPYVLGIKVSISPAVGIILTVSFLILVYLSFAGFRFNKNVLIHILAAYSITILISVILGLMLNYITIKELFSLSFFGSVPVAAALVGVSSAILFDWKDLTNVLSTMPTETKENNPSKVKSFCTAKFKKEKDIQDCEKKLG